MRKVVTSTSRKYPYIDAYLIGLKKKIGLERQVDCIETLILGSSHGQYAYVPRRGEYNLCLPSQDLHYSYALYKKYRAKFKKLKNVILFYSVFSPGFDVLKGSESYRGYHYEQIFGIKPNIRGFSKKMHGLYDSFCKNIEKEASKLKISETYRGRNPDIKGKNVGRLGVTNYVKRAEVHLKGNLRESRQTPYVEKLIQSAQQRQVRVTVVLSPAHVKYRGSLPAAAELFADLFELLKSHPEVKLADFYSQDVLANDDFWWDYDHLNPAGARQFTQLYHQQIKEK